jgi:hypothetical protein
LSDEGLARVYVRRLGAHRAGHVGWAFLLPGGWWEAGGVERGGVVTPPIADGFRSEELPDPNPRMSALDYDAYKELEVALPNVSAAREKELEIDQRLFTLLKHNCMNDTYDVLTAYGAVLPSPDPEADWKPNDWYRTLGGDERRL